MERHPLESNLSQALSLVTWICRLFGAEDAVMGKFSAVIDLLMDQHADLNLEEMEQFIKLVVICCGPCWSILKVLNGASEIHSMKDPATALCDAASSGNLMASWSCKG